MASGFVNIPVFIPELACPHQCVFCDQRKITGQNVLPSDDDIHQTITSHLKTVGPDKQVMIAFFGGSFTGIASSLQEHYLALVQPYIRNGEVASIRLSTRPDYINQEILDRLKHYQVSNIELGAQSLDDDVLRQAGRGHTRKQVEEASKLILQNDVVLGLQMMTGLPGDTDKKAFETAQTIVEWGARETRIYPTLVVRGTALEKRYQNGAYVPQTIEEAVELSAKLLGVFEKHAVKVLRLGLYASDLLRGKDYIAGPLHSHFAEMVRSQQWYLKLHAQDLSSGVVFVHPRDLNYAVGYKQMNKKKLQQIYPGLRFVVDRQLEEGGFRC